jgi:hypothetical protein
MKKIALFLISTLCLATAVAQDDAVQEELEEAPKIRRYTVEVIVFSYLEDVSVGTEQFLPDEPPPEEEPLLDEDGNPIEALEEPEDAVAEIIDPDLEIEAEEPFVWIVGIGEDDEDENDEQAKFELVLLTEDEFQLSDAIRQFELLDVYEMILHTGWTQPTYPAEETPPIELLLLGETPDGLNGTLTLYLSRYLHLVVDLALDAPVEVVELPDENSFFSYNDARRQYGRDFDAPPPQPVRYRIQENRIVRNGELRYFDHPKFGVLARIARVEEPEEEELEESESAQPLLSSSGQ